ncbi:MAG: 2-oxoglutarate-dependent dioxygenase [Paraburkholderia sp.]|nr:MAG: 2-oxoglutarate-dependent dioxygenase [Paraburkholderia sp.]
MNSPPATYPAIELRESAVHFPDGRAARILAHRVFAPASSQWVLLEGFLTDAECDALVELSSGTLEPARVVSAVTRAESFTTARIGHVGLLFGAEHDLIKRIETRIEALTRWPRSHFQPMQLSYYGMGDGFKLHHDFFDPAIPAYHDALKRQGQRLATLIVYLNDCAGSGNTVFPSLDGLFVAPQKGNALFFSYAGTATHPDRRLLHGSTPVSAGHKWIATTWLCAQPQDRDRRGQSNLD